MAPRAAVVESERLRATTQVAFGVLAANAFEQAGQLWLSEVEGSSTVGRAAASWMGKMLRALRVWRRQAMEVAAAASALDQGLRSGTVAVPPGQVGGAEVSAAALRREYRQKVTLYAKEALSPGDGFEPWAGDGPAAVFRVEQAKDLRSVFEDIEREWEAAAREHLEEVAVENVKRAQAVKVRDGVADRTADLDARRAREAELAAQKAGTVVSHNVQSAARDANFRIANANPGVIAWARKNFPKDGSQPCAFCLLLLANGASYRTGKSAGGDIGEPHSFHPNCRCQAVPLYRGEIYLMMDEFAENHAAHQFYLEHYPQSGASQKVRFNAFRRAVYAKNRAAGKS